MMEIQKDYYLNFINLCLCLTDIFVSSRASIFLHPRICEIANISSFILAIRVGFKEFFSE